MLLGLSQIGPEFLDLSPEAVLGDHITIEAPQSPGDRLIGAYEISSLVAAHPHWSTFLGSEFKQPFAKAIQLLLGLR